MKEPQMYFFTSKRISVNISAVRASGSSMKALHQNAQKGEHPGDEGDDEHPEERGSSCEGGR